MDQHTDGHPEPVPEDAREATEDQREAEEKLEHAGNEDPAAPGLQQSADNVADESRR